MVESIELPFEIKKDSYGGLGAFASRDIKKGELLLMEDHLFEATCTRNEEEWNALAPEKQALCLELTDLYAQEGSDKSIEGIMKSNALPTEGGFGALYKVATRINHSCDPNV